MLKRLRRVWARRWGDYVPYEPHPSLYLTLTVKYLFLTAYGLLATAFGVTTLAVTVGAVWNVAITIVVSLSAMGATIGVQLSRRYRARLVSDNPLPERMLLLEIISEFALIASLFSYSVAIVVRAFVDGDYERLSYAVLPLTVSIVPLYRMLHLVEKEQ